MQQPTSETFKSRKALKQFVQSFNDESLATLQDIVNTVIDSREAKRARMEQERRDKEQRGAELVSLVAAEGFTLEELTALASGDSKRKRPPKYQFTHNGKIHFWSGVGKMPASLSALITEERPLETFLIAGK